MLRGIVMDEIRIDIRSRMLGVRKTLMKQVVDMYGMHGDMQLEPLEQFNEINAENIWLTVREQVSFIVNNKRLAVFKFLK